MTPTPDKALDPLFTRTHDRMENTRSQFEAQAQRYRALAATAHPEFKQQYLDLADSIEDYLRQIPRPLMSQVEGAE